MAAKYGDVFTVYLGSQRVVVLNGYDTIKDALAKQGYAFSGRPDLFFIKELTEGYGIVSSQGEFWREQRRHSLHVLRDFGFGRTVLEDRIIEEVGFFIEELTKYTHEPYNPKQLLQMSIANVIASVTFGHRYDYGDKTFKVYLDIMDKSFEVLGNSGMLQLFPFVRFLPGDFFHYKALMRNKVYMDAQYDAIIHKHKETLVDSKEATDVIAAYLMKIADEKKAGAVDSTYTEKQLSGIIGDLFNAGTDTTATTLTWALIYMILNQDIQNKVHAEIDDVMDKSSTLTMHLRSKLPFTEACLNEVQRLADVVPLGVPHATIEDVNFMGYHIPKNTMVMPHMYSVHHDSKYWPNPYKFDPNRFLDQDGKVIKREELIPFSIGKRVCIGESLARMELFLYFTSMLQHFHFRPAQGHPAPDTQGILSIVNLPKPFKMSIENRQMTSRRH